MTVKENRHICKKCERFKCDSIMRLNLHLVDCGCTLENDDCRNCTENQVLDKIFLGGI